MLAALALVGAPAWATEIGESRNFGLGLQFGEPNLLTGKMYFGSDRVSAVDGALGLYLDAPIEDAFYAQAAYHLHILELSQGDAVAIPFRVGLGAFLTTGFWRWSDEGEGHDVIVGLRAPIGLDFDFRAVPIQLYIEAALDMTLLPPLEFGGDGGIGVRYYF